MRRHFPSIHGDQTHTRARAMHGHVVDTGPWESWKREEATAYMPASRNLEPSGIKPRDP